MSICTSTTIFYVLFYFLEISVSATVRNENNQTSSSINDNNARSSELQNVVPYIKYESTSISTSTTVIQNKDIYSSSTLHTNSISVVTSESKNDNISSSLIYSNDYQTNSATSNCVENESKESITTVIIKNEINTDVSASDDPIEDVDDFLNSLL